MIDLKSFQMGLAMGLSGKPLPLAKKEPIAYLYNGVELPDINEVWTDKEKYPYAYLTVMDGSDIAEGSCLYTVTFTNRTAVWLNGLLGVANITEAVNYCDVRMTNSAELSQHIAENMGSLGLGEIPVGSWSELIYTEKEAGTANYVGIGFGDVAWANADVLNEDGTTYLAASEPVPVYE